MQGQNRSLRVTIINFYLFIQIPNLQTSLCVCVFFFARFSPRRRLSGVNLSIRILSPFMGFFIWRERNGLDLCRLGWRIVML
jgi:hypothetical protein